MSACDICGREKGPVPPLCGRDRPGATFPDMADCYSTGFYRLKREKTLAGQQIDALVADARAAYPTCTECGEDIIPNDGEVCGLCARTELAAAEERGRRAGIEEAAKEVESYRAVAAFGGARTLLGELVARIRALAPRDSGTKHKDWCALFGNPEAGKSCDCHEDRK